MSFPSLQCSACEEPEVSGWCVQCEEALCSDCVSAHRRVKVTRDHEVKHTIPPTGETPSRAVFSPLSQTCRYTLESVLLVCSVGMPRRRCPSHSQESLRFFCLVCDELTCKDCQLITHRGHRYNQWKQRFHYRSFSHSIFKSICVAVLCSRRKLKNLRDGGYRVCRSLSENKKRRLAPACSSLKRGN